MHTLRMAALAAVTTCALMLAGTTAANAATTTKFARKVAVTGTHGFKGKFTINRFVTRGGKVYAVGRLVGKARGKRVARNVRIPARLNNSGASSAQLPPIPNSCQILNLVLGPINLNLLGLVVRTNRINVRIDAVPGAGNLLGNLLCGITGILNPSSGSAPAVSPSQLSRILTALLQLV